MKQQHKGILHLFHYYKERIVLIHNVASEQNEFELGI